MTPTRRDALLELSALFAIPLIRWPESIADPLAGTIAEYQAGRARRDWSAAEVTKVALERAKLKLSNHRVYAKTGTVALEYDVV